MSKRNVVVIAYTAPGPEWDTVRQHAAQVKAVVFNPSNGVGAAKDAAYAALREEMRRLGVLVIGYVYTASGPIGGDRVYSNRNPGEILDEVRRWKAWYDVDGCFFDEVSQHADRVPYGRRTVGTARAVISPEAFIVLNFGTAPDQAWSEIDTVMCVTEKRQSTYLNEPVPDWMRTIPPDRLLAIIYDVSDIPAVMARFAANGHGLIYLTDLPGTDPQYAVDRTLWPPSEATPAQPPTSPDTNQITENQAVGILLQVAVELKAEAGMTLALIPGLVKHRMDELAQCRAEVARLTTQGSLRLAAADDDQIIEDLKRRLANRRMI